MKFLLAALLLSSCSAVKGVEGGGAVQVWRCEVIVGGDLGALPPTRGGPFPLEDEGYGVMCDLWRF